MKYLPVLAEELLIHFPNVSEDNAMRYAEALYGQQICIFNEFEAQVREKNKQTRFGATSWLKALNFMSLTSLKS